ncbi:MAG: DUF1566 domain-containing protein [Woeseia sp.]
MEKLLTAILFAFLAAACNQVPDPALVAHDTKFSGVGEAPYACVLDKLTGLYWEVKSDQPGLHDWRNTYTWFDPDGDHGELDYRGTENGGVCVGSLCDTAHYAEAVNETGFCGFSDWRVPAKNELYSISDLRRHENPPTINTRFFPNTQSGEYWSVNDYSFQHNAAWGWSFEFGLDRVDWKATPKYLRLVRGTATELPAVKE